MGSGGSTTATPHQADAVKDQSSSVTRERDQAGSGSSQAPGGPAAGQPSAKGTEAGAAPSEKPKQ
jgi:hypothetical protein